MHQLTSYKPEIDYLMSDNTPLSQQKVSKMNKCYECNKRYVIVSVSFVIK